VLVVARSRRVWRLIRRVWVGLGIGLTVGFVVWSLVAYRANAAASSDAVVAVDRTDGVWSFAPRRGSPGRAALLFFPGALVDPRAYAPLARAVAGAGYPARIVELPHRGAFGGADSPDIEPRVRSALASLPDSARIVVGGHSRGAVVASRIVSRRPPWLAGLVLIGTSHPRDHDLSRLIVPVTKIVGTRDGLATPGEVEANAALLPYALGLDRGRQPLAVRLVRFPAARPAAPPERGRAEADPDRERARARAPGRRRSAAGTQRRNSVAGPACTCRSTRAAPGRGSCTFPLKRTDARAKATSVTVFRGVVQAAARRVE